MNPSRLPIADAKRLVIKIGSALLTDDGRGLNVSLIQQLVEQMAILRQQGREIVIVSSGAVAAGLTRMNLSQRPSNLNELQAMAAIGQMRLVQTWENAFAKHGLHAAQVLLTHEDVHDRQRYLNARGTLRALLGYGVVPVVNENDTVATKEVRLGDNDTLAGLVVNLIDADAMLILTDQQGMFDSDPRINPEAKLLDNLVVDDPELMVMAGGSAGALGRGGMRTKVTAAQQAAYAGAYTVIAGGKQFDIVTAVAAGELVGSLFLPNEKPITARKRWIAAQSPSRGVLVCDQGAVNAIQEGGTSLLPAGVTAVRGDFDSGDCVRCVTEDGTEVARGLVNYDASEASQICGLTSEEIPAVLGCVSTPVLIHYDDMLVGHITA